MKFSIFTLLAITVSSVAAAPQPFDSLSSSSQSLEKRKGGGGGKGGGSGSSGGKSGSGSGSYLPSSNTGGRTRDGSGSPKTYGNYYTGGASVPYKSGSPSPSRGITPYALPIAAVAFFPALWFYPVWAYPYSYGYHWYANGQNMTSNVTCLCEDFAECGCDPTDNSTFLATVLTNGSTSGPPVNSSTVRTIDWGNGTIASYINGTLDNGTTASGGTDPSNDAEASPATRLVAGYAGYWMMVALVVMSVTLV